jgi:carboxyl-terminal processing protease
MRKTLLWVLGAMAIVGLIAGAFAGGLVVGRASTGLIPQERPVLTEEPTAAPNDEENANAEATAEPTDNPNPQVNQALVDEVLELLEEDFYGEIPDDQTLTHGAIRGMVQTLDDPYTSFVEPKVADILREDATGSFEGIGATVRMREDGYLEIVQPLPDHPAEAAGLQSGDLIVSVDGESIVGIGLYEALNMIRGPADTDVTLEIVRPGESDSFEVTITRARIKNPIVESEMLDDDIAYLRLTEFSRTARERLESELQMLLKENPKGLVFDLRGNPGGYLNQAIQVADLFLDKGLVAIERDSRGNEQRFSSRNGDLGEDIPLVVLVDGGSASASEIVAGALRDRDRAVLIGQPTLGKGSVQIPHDLSDDSQLRVTIARWFTPDDVSIHEDGLTPEIEVPYPSDTPVDEDPQLDRAVEYLLSGE